ncbi:MAG: VOC family protein [Caulobacterales bacterium]
MIGYVTIGAEDVAAALPFYDGVFGAIGGERKSFEEGGWAFYGPKGADGNVGVCKPFDGKPARGGNGIMIAFTAPTKAAVEAAHAAGLAGGGTDEGAPGFRPPDGKNFYGAYLRDPTGNKLCIFTML